MEPLNVAFIGGGRIADVHAVFYGRDARARIHTVCDRDPAVAERRSAEWGAVRHTTEAAKVLADPEVDAVEILTPQSSHEALAIAALEAGKHVALQKPMTTSLQSADRILQAARRSGKVFKVTENYVFYPPIVQCRKLIDDGVIGDPIGLRIKLIAGPKGGWDVPATAWQWRVEEASAGRGFLAFDHGHHLWSTAWYLMGAFERVSAWIDSIDGVVDAPATVMWKHDGGRRYGICDLIHAPELHIPSDYYANDEWIEVTGSKGLLVVRRCTGKILDGPVLSHFDGHRWHEYDPPSDWAEGFVGATENFVSAMRGEAAARLSGDEAREVLRFSLALGRASRERREVTMEELEHRMPGLYAWRRRRRELREGGLGLLERLGLGQNLSRYAAIARPLTEQLARDYDRAVAARLDMVIGVHLTPDAGVEEKLGILVRDGKLEVSFGAIPDDASLTLRMPAGVWGAILARKTRIETALFRGKIQFEGKAEHGLRLRELFGF